MNDLNQCNFIGRLGDDPRTRDTTSGSVCSFRIAVGWKSKEKDGTEWVSIVTFGKLAEICGQYLKKGSRVFVSGSFKTRKYEKDGRDVYVTEISANHMQMLDGKPSGGGQHNPAKPAAEEGFSEPAFNDPFDDSRIPF